MPIEPVLIDARDTALIFEGGGTRNSYTDFVGNREFGGWRTVVRGKGLLNGEFIYEGYEQKLPFDLETFLSTEEQIHIEAVRADTGETVAYNREDLVHPAASDEDARG